MSSVIRDRNGFEHLAETYFPNTDGGTTTDFFGTLSADTPFHALVLKPTAASFGTAKTQYSALIFGNIEQGQMILVLFTNGNFGDTALGTGLKLLLNLDIPNDSPGMWVISILVPEDGDLENVDTNDIKLFQITDGTQILMPEVKLAELTGLESAEIFPTVDDQCGIFQGSFEGEDINITAIDGCEICFRWTHTQVLQYLLDQHTNRPLRNSDRLNVVLNRKMESLHSLGQSIQQSMTRHTTEQEFLERRL